MKCSCCGATATRLGEYTAPGQPESKRAFCADKKCEPKGTGWTFYQLGGQR